MGEAFHELHLDREIALVRLLERLDFLVELLAALAPAIGVVLLADHEREAHVAQAERRDGAVGRGGRAGVDGGEAVGDLGPDVEAP